MKSIKELREQYQVITEKEDKEQRKLTALVRAGLFDAKKLPVLKRALEKGVDKMTPAEKKILIDLLDSLMNQVISNEPVYMKVKRNVQSMDEEVIAEVAKTPVTIADVPSIVVLKRKAVRVYPGGQQVGLYYSQQLDKYVTIPFGEAGISEEVDLEEARRRPGKTQQPRYFGSRRNDDDYDNDDYKARRAEQNPFEKLKAGERELVTPGKVFGRHIQNGLPAATAGAITAALLGRSNRKERSAKAADLRQVRNSAAYKKKIRARASQIAKNKKPQNLPEEQVNEVVGKLLGIGGSFALKQGGKLLSKGKDILKKYWNKKGNSKPPKPPKTAAERAAARRAALDKTKKLRDKNKNPFKGGKGGKGGKGRRGGKIGRLAAGLGALGLAGAGSGSEGQKASNLVTHNRTSQLTTKVVDPSRSQIRGSQDTQDYNTQRKLNKTYMQQPPSRLSESIDINLDGNIFKINSSIAEKLVNIYESLKENNRQKMVDMLMNEETQHKIVEFVRRY